MEFMLMLIIVLGATGAMLNLGRITENISFPANKLGYVNNQAKYQVLLLGVALSVLLILFFAYPANLKTFFTLGGLAAPVRLPAGMDSISGLTWVGLGLSLSFFITMGTTIFIYLQFRNSGGAWEKFIPYVPWVLLFSFSNSFSEEVVYRLGVIVPLNGTMDGSSILLISAIAFGLPHLRGMPNGIVGALMSGFLGWLLAKSVMDTSGIFWAWFIHFIQDVVIFSAFVLAAISQAIQQTRGMEKLSAADMDRDTP